MNYQHLTDIEKVDLAYKILHSVNDEVLRLWRMAWGLKHKECMSAWEYDKTKLLIELYGYTKVREAFQDSAEHGVFNLKYVGAILKNTLAREMTIKEEEENRLRKIKLAKQSREEQLPDIEAVRNAFKFPEPIKEKKPENYEKSKLEFEAELKMEKYK